MNKIIHLYGESQFHTYGTVCGLGVNHKALETNKRSKVTCKNCKKTKRFKKLRG